MVEVIQAQEEWHTTGARNEQVVHQQKGICGERLCPVSTEPGSMMGFTPLTVQLRIWRRGRTNPWTVPRPNVYHRDKWFRVVKKGEKVKGPVVVSSTPAAVLCKSTMAESILYTDRAARAEAGGLRHGKHSSLPKRVAASHSLRQQQMRHTQTWRSHTFFTLKKVHTLMYTLSYAFPWESSKKMKSQKRQTANYMGWI